MIQPSLAGLALFVEVIPALASAQKSQTRRSVLGYFQASLRDSF